MHKSSYGPCILGNRNLCIVIGYSSRRGQSIKPEYTLLIGLTTWEINKIFIFGAKALQLELVEVKGLHSKHQNLVYCPGNELVDPLIHLLLIFIFTTHTSNHSKFALLIPLS